MPNKRRRLWVHGTNKMTSKDEAVRDGRRIGLVMVIAEVLNIFMMIWLLKYQDGSLQPVVVEVSTAHLQQASPSTFFVFHRLNRDRLNHNETEKLDFFFTHDDDGKASVYMKRVINRSLVQRWEHQMRDQDVRPIACCNGLILFKSPEVSSKFYIGNPVTGELRTMKHRTSNPFQYAILTLGSTKWRGLRTLPYCPRYGSSPVILNNNTLYWMTAEIPNSTCENSIVMFSMDSEEFHTMSHPSYKCKTSHCHQRLNLLEMEAHAQDNCKVQLVSIQNKELLLVWPGLGVFHYNVLTNAVTKIELEGNKAFHCIQGHLLLTRYTKSVTSLNNFYPIPASPKSMPNRCILKNIGSTISKLRNKLAI
ncbi:hypothetical protein PVK06_041163 [Gossypium arboreum]|uniref:F-box associated domain-containing protein n=1 Tax=Gossypium arboreum TaxID=29729 RepID=A0ABR0N7F8_GOSAR|nr:hypothetical protein PVK06_041163 [Gossypium arboreum]